MSEDDVGGVQGKTFPVAQKTSAVVLARGKTSQRVCTPLKISYFAILANEVNEGRECKAVKQFEQDDGS